MKKRRKKNKSKSVIDMYDVYKSVRRDWGEVKPYERIDKDKKKYSRKRKHKKEDYEREN